MSLLLTPAHLQRLLTTYAIADPLVRHRGYQSLPQPEDLIDRGFTKAQAKAAPALGIPLWDVHGQRRGWQMRPDAPRHFASGKVGKYEVPTGDRLILDVHPSVQPQIGDPTVPLWITEGVPKGDSLVSRGVCALALVGGVWGFRGTNEHGGKVILSDWESVALNGRHVHVVFDSDLHTNRRVAGALKALYTLLRSRGAIPSLVQWPEAYRERKWGVDDFFAAGHTLEELRAMLPADGPLPERPPVASRGGVTFDCTKSGEVRVALLNVLYVFEQDPRWHQVLGFNLLLNDVMLLARPPYLDGAEPWVPRPVTEQDWAETANWLQRTYHLYVGSALAGEGLTTYARRCPFHPIQDYLHGLTWDGVARLDTWLTVYCHVADTPYSRAVGSKTLIAGVARIEDPGCKVDTLPILQGAQGLGKSQALRTLTGDAWFTDGLPDLHNKDAAQALLGTWVVELSELSQFQRSEIETVKAFISRQADHYRPSYGRRAATFPRQQIFVASSNEDHLFKDRTGNRRYWPVTVAAPCDLAALQRDRDHLWAEAVVRYRAGEAWHLDPDTEALAREEQASRLEPDDWEEPVLTYTETCKHLNHDCTLYYITTLELLTHCLRFDNPILHTMANTRRLGGILRSNGWKPYPVRDEPKGKQIKAFVKPAALTPPPTPGGAVTAVTATSATHAPTGNGVSPSNTVSVTAVTAVTGSVYTQGEKNEENVKNVVLRNYDIFPGNFLGISGNSGNSGNDVPQRPFVCGFTDNADISASIGNAPRLDTIGNGAPPAFCPGCGRATTWLQRDTFHECYKCHTCIPVQGRRPSDAQ